MKTKDPMTDPLISTHPARSGWLMPRGSGAEELYPGKPGISMAIVTPEALFCEAGKGRRQASLAGSRLESHLYRQPQAVSALNIQTMAYLSGLDLTVNGRAVQAAGQAIIRRLNEALDGHGRRIAAILLSPQDIASLRAFRHEVRNLMSAPPGLRQQNPATSNHMQRKGFAHEAEQ